ncbi:MAG: AAA family ATPase [Pseudomonadota bacterium]
MNDPATPPLIHALLDPARWPHGAEDLRLVETHISWVLLVGDYAYKIKKPLDLGFLDFSTLAKRRHYCEEELRLNRRLAPSIYLDVLPIAGTAEAPEPGRDEGAIEYAVQMRRFDDGAQLDRLLERGELKASQIDAFAAMVAAFHLRIPAATAERPEGEPAAVWAPMAENFAQIREHLGGEAPQAQLRELEQWSHAQYDRLLPTLSARKREGYIRECHGDMHLRNLAWLDGGPIAFDGIEFNPALRWIDLISEIAFLVMDLHQRGEPRLAQRFLNGYLERSGDYAGLALLPFYLVYRALVRAKVAAIRAGQDGLAERERADAWREFADYLLLAEGYTRPEPPVLVLTRGPSGSGKSHHTGPLLEHLGAIRLRSDVERKRLYGLRPEEDGHAAPGEGIYSREASDRTYARLTELARVVLDAGYPVIVDAVCQHSEQRAPFITLARERGVKWLLLEFQAPAAVLAQRLAARKGDASDADEAVLQRQLANWPPLSEAERQATLYVDSSEGVEPSLLYRRLCQRLN